MPHVPHAITQLMIRLVFKRYECDYEYENAAHFIVLFMITVECSSHHLNEFFSVFYSDEYYCFSRYTLYSMFTYFLTCAVVKSGVLHKVSYSYQ